LFERPITWLAGIDRNNKIVISPLGATNNKGETGSRNILRNIYRRMNIPTVMATAQITVERLRSSLVSIKKPNSKKNNARIKNAASIVNSFNF
jgi:hypothetical protein